MNCGVLTPFAANFVPSLEDTHPTLSLADVSVLRAMRPNRKSLSR
jgi:hypothetical protein